MNKYNYITLQGVSCIVMTKEEYKKIDKDFRGKSYPETWPQFGSVKILMHSDNGGLCLQPVFYPDEVENYKNPPAEWRKFKQWDNEVYPGRFWVYITYFDKKEDHYKLLTYNSAGQFMESDEYTKEEFPHVLKTLEMMENISKEAK